MTTATVMDDKPLTMTEAWRVYDPLYDDDRVTFIAGKPGGKPGEVHQVHLDLFPDVVTLPSPRR